MARTELTIGDVARATGVGESTLRAWEQRYGFPAPRRLRSGHRRYGPDDVERIARVLAERERGLALGPAIERAGGEREAVPSIFARLRERRPDVQPVAVRKRALTELTRAVEEESCARAERPLLIGSFQREGLYRQSEARWRDLARGALAAFALADFRRLRRPRAAPVEVPVEHSHPLAREWALVCLAPEHAACLVAWEPPGRRARPDGAREFELLLSAEPSVVREAAQAGVGILSDQGAGPGDAVRDRVRAEPAVAAGAQLRLATAVTARLLARLP